MKIYQPKPMNEFQRQRAPRAVSDAAFAKLREQLADENLFFKNQTYWNEITDSQTGVKTKIWFDKRSAKWNAEFTFPDGSTQSIEADSREELLLAVAASRAQTTVENLEAEREVNPVFDSPWEKVVHDWMTKYKWGKRFAAWSEFLAPSALDEVCQLIKTKAGQMYGKPSRTDPCYLEWVYIELLDAGELDAYENAAKTNRKWQDEAEAKNAERDALAEDLRQRTEAGYERAMSEYEREESEKRLAEDRKLSKTKKGMAELRRRSIFGDKTNAFPVSTGTARRV